MGCGSSSLKGDASAGGGLTSADGDPAPRPIKKVATNFSTVDYDTDPGQKRRNTEYAPNETVRQPSAIHESRHEDPIALATNGVTAKEKSGKETLGKDNHELKPYHTADGDDWLASPTETKTAPPFTNGTSDMDPATPASKSSSPSKDTTLLPSSEITQEGTTTRNQSWLGKKYSQYDGARRHLGRELSDEQLQKYTGKSKEEIQRLVGEGKGVGGGQSTDMRNTPGPGAGWSGAGGGAG